MLTIGDFNSFWGFFGTPCTCVHENQYAILYFLAHFELPWEYSLLYFHGNSWWRLKFIMRILFDLNMISILVFSGLFWQAGTTEQFIHCFCALEQITQVV